jgi:hypothetical protein
MKHEPGYDNAKTRTLTRIAVAALGGYVAATALLMSTPDSHAAGARPLFQAPFACGQVWEASTYDGHWPDQDSIDLAERDGNNKVISDGQPVLASAAGVVKEVFVSSGGDNRVYIDHGDGWVTHYIHVEIDPKKPMFVGRKVAQGEYIARTSNTGADEVHLHYSQVADGKAVGIKFNGSSIKTHAGNADSYNTWGTGKAEKIISLNCAGNSFMGWYDSGTRYNLIYKPGYGDTKIVKMDGNGEAANSTWSGKWSRGWTHFTPFYSKTGGHPHAVLYKHATGKVSFIRMNLNGKGITNLKSGTWWKGWTHFVPFARGGQPYFLAYDSVHGHVNIDRIKTTNDGSTSVFQTTWGEGRTQIVPFELGPSQYMLLYEGGSGKAKVVRIDGSGDNISVASIWSGNWSAGYTTIVPVDHEGAQYLLAYKAGTGAAKIIKPKSGGQGVTTTASMNWSKPWTALSAFSKGGKGRLLIYKIGTGQVKTIKFKSGGTGIDTVWNKTWTWGWK